jgi:hypothetical protein
MLSSTYLSRLYVLRFIAPKPPAPDPGCHYSGDPAVLLFRVDRRQRSVTPRRGGYANPCPVSDLDADSCTVGCLPAERNPHLTSHHDPYTDSYGHTHDDAHVHGHPNAYRNAHGNSCGNSHAHRNRHEHQYTRTYRHSAADRYTSPLRHPRSDSNGNPNRPAPDFRDAGPPAFTSSGNSHQCAPAARCQPDAYLRLFIRQDGPALNPL